MTAHHPFAQLLAEHGLLPPARPAANGAAGPPPPGGDPQARRYAQAALVSESDRLAGTPPGGRNHALNTASYRMGQLVARGYLAAEDVTDVLLHAADACGLPPGEAHATLRSGLSAGQQAPRDGIALAAHTVPPAYTVEPAGTPVPAQISEGEQDPLGDGLPTPVDWHAWWASAPVEPDWLIPQVLERGRSHVLYAPHKAGKSLLTLSWCGQLARAGHPVLYVDLENTPADVVERLQDMGYTPADLATLHYFSFPVMAALDTPAGGATLAALVAKYAPELVVLDTTARVVTGKENESDTYRALYRYALVPLKAAGVTVLRLDHAGKDPTAGQRGSSAKGDDVDTVWLLLRHDDTRYQLKCDAQRSGHHPPTLDLVKREDPLRFDAVTADPFSRPEVAAVVGHLDRLQVPEDAGRETARAALTRAGHKIRNGTLAEAIRARKNRLTSWDDLSGTGAAKLIMNKINNDDPHDQLSFPVSPAQTCPGQVGDSGDSEAGASETRPVPDCPPLRGGQARGQVAQAGPGPTAPSAPEGPPAAPAATPSAQPSPSPPPSRTAALRRAVAGHPAPSTDDPARPFVCQRCHRAAEALIGWRGAMWACEACAYPNPADRPGHASEEDE